MSKKSDLLKSIVKKNPADKPTFGTNPRDPWSTKANITEDAILNRFLKSRGINPEHVTKDQKVAHSKMGEFLKWKKDHMFEETDKKDMVCFDIPLLIRVLEFTREEMSSDIELHNMVERLINMRHDVPMDMSHYDEITQKLVKENHIAIAMGKMLDDESGMVLTQIEELERGCAMVRSYIGKDYEKQLPAWVQAKVTLATDYMSTVGNYLISKNENVKEEYKDFLEDSTYGTRADKLLARSHSAHQAGDTSTGSRAHKLFLKARDKHWSNPVNKEKAINAQMSGANKDYTSGKRYTGDSVEHSGDNVISEISDTTLSSYKEKAKKSADTLHAQGQYKKSADRWLNVMKATGKQIDKMQKENTMDPMAATQAPCDCANTSDDVAPKDKNKKLIQMSKSARIIKSIYKNKNMKEEIYDTEKEGKSVATYGKKPKMTNNEKKIEAVGGQPKAAAIMTGGTTLTGTPRDTIEIDPMMKIKGLRGQQKTV
jgi:hypothetical protein